MPVVSSSLLLRGQPLDRQNMAQPPPTSAVTLKPTPFVWYKAVAKPYWQNYQPNNSWRVALMISSSFPVRKPVQPQLLMVEPTVQITELVQGSGNPTAVYEAVSGTLTAVAPVQVAVTVTQTFTPTPTRTPIMTNTPRPDQHA